MEIAARTSFSVHSVQLGYKCGSVYSIDTVLSTLCGDSLDPQKQVYEIDICSILHMRLVLVSKWDPNPWSRPSESGHMCCNQCSCIGPPA